LGWIFLVDPAQLCQLGAEDRVGMGMALQVLQDCFLDLGEIRS
jgi:hypothetical protein